MGLTPRRGLTVHPRACGEHRPDSECKAVMLGSSPRVRGTLSSARWYVHRSRFIPARAGNTTAECGPARRSTVHPRACGEHSRVGISYTRSYGSSPRVRGTLLMDIRHELQRRFIPARAGNTSAKITFPCSSTVHPRACGEHAQVLATAKLYTGSSPRVRGTRGHGRARSAHNRFIPARAGNTCLAGVAAVGLAVHPRACGEHFLDDYV